MAAVYSAVFFYLKKFCYLKAVVVTIAAFFVLNSFISIQSD